MGKKKKQEWSIGDLFIVPQKDDLSTIGQILDLMIPTVVTCAFYDIRVTNDNIPDEIHLGFDNLISCVSVTREQLDYFAWTVIKRNHPINIERKYWANEQYRQSRWVGAEIYDAALVEDFLNAFYGLAPWDDWYDPNFLDEFLISMEKKPHNLIYTNTQR